METCDQCPNGKFQREYGQTSCEICVPGFYCKEGAAEPVPCPAGYVGNATGLDSPGQCTPVPRGFWAPLGSNIPEPCPASGFYCPGALRDDVHGGSKPVIMPVGQSTETQEVETVQQTMTVDLSFDDFASQRAALIQRLAAQYGVDPSLITLEANAARRRSRALQSGGLELTITIATNDGSGNAVDLAVIEQAAAAVDATALATTISEVTVAAGLPPVKVTALQPPARATTEIEVPFACPRGKWCTAGLVVSCPLGTYNPLEDQDFATACVICPLNSYTKETTSSSRAECICDAGYYDANASTAVDQDLIDNMIRAEKDPVTMVADVIDCQVCPYGTNCGQGETIKELPLVRGFYRIGDDSTDVRKCPDADSNCSTTFGTNACVSTSGCIGGTDSANLCGAGLNGTFCRTCVQDPEPGAMVVFYVKASEKQDSHCQECGNNLGQTTGIAAAALAAFGAVALGFARIRNKPSIRYFMQTFTPQNKAKILIGFYMIATKIDIIYDVALPADVRTILRALSSVFTFGMQGVATTPLACLGFSGYVPELIFWILFPMACVAVVLVIVLLSTCLQWRKTLLAKNDANVNLKHQSTRRPNEGHAGMQIVAADGAPRAPASEQTFLEKALPPVLKIIFVLYPIVTTTAFEGFPCYEFESGDGWLIADVMIKCRTPEHASAQTLAWIAVFVYPIGLWLGTLMLLLSASKAIVSGNETPLSRACYFLYKEYDPTCFWWELMEMGRKFLLVGLFVWQPTQGSITQIAAGTIVAAVYLMIQLEARPYKNATDDYLATASSFGLLMLFICSILFKFTTLTDTEDIQDKMSIEQKGDYVVSTLAISVTLIASVLGSLVMVALIAVVQVIVETRKARALRRLKYVKNGKWVELAPLGDPQAFHLFLSHAWPAAQDRMRIIKARFLEVLPSARVFLDVDNLMSGSGTTEVDKSECILVFCTSQYFEKKNSLKELYRAVTQRRPILALLEPDETQDGGLDRAAVEVLLTDKRLDTFKLRERWAEWKEEGELLPTAFDHAPECAEVAAALFAMPPVEWNRLPHFQDVTIRLIAQNGILHGQSGELYIQGEAATAEVALPPPLKGRKYHLFVSAHDDGAAELVVNELNGTDILVKTAGPKVSPEVLWTHNVAELALCDHMLVHLDAKTWSSGAQTAALVEEIHQAMRLGVHMMCVHEFPGIVGPPRNECEFGLMFRDDWTPAHLISGPTNLYKEIALALKGCEWRKPGLVALAGKLATSARPHKPIDVVVPDSYEPLTGAAKQPEAAPPAARMSVKLQGAASGKGGETRADFLDEMLEERQSSLAHDEMRDHPRAAEREVAAVKLQAAMRGRRVRTQMAEVRTFQSREERKARLEQIRARRTAASGARKAVAPSPPPVPGPEAEQNLSDRIKGFFTPKMEAPVEQRLDA